MRTNWEHFSLLDNGVKLSTYNFITILIATFVCALVAFLYYRFCYDSIKKDLLLVLLGMGIGVVLMCIAQVSKMADEEMEELKKERIDKE